MVSISSCSVDFPEVLSNPGFGSSSSFHTNEYSGSSDTDDFIREVAERHNISYSLLKKTHSEDEISDPFSLSSSHHSLLIVESDLEKDGSCSPEDLDSPADTKEKEPRNSYSLSSCAVTLSPPIGNGFIMATERDMEDFVQSGVNIILPDEEAHLNSNGSTLRPLHSFKRQGALLESTEDTELNCLTPTNMMSNSEGMSLSTTPTPQVDVKTDGEVSPDVSTYDDLEILIDEIMCGEGGSTGLKIPVPTRRHSNCDPASREVVSLVPLYQRRTSVTVAPLLAATPFTLIPPSEDTRKLSDPAVCLRKERVKNSYMYMTKQKRCLSDSEAPNISTDDDDCKSEECESSALDSGFHDSRFQDGSSVNYPPSSRMSLDNLSDDFMEPPLVSPSKIRRPTPFSPFCPATPDRGNTVMWPWDDTSQLGGQANSGLITQPKRSLGRQSQSSVATSSEGVSISSFWESQMSQISALDILSSLGFDDYDSSQLIPDRFIPKDVEHVKPSLMRSMSFDEDELLYASRAPSISTMSESSVSSSQPVHRPLTTSTRDLPLGATAENFFVPSSPPPQPAQTTPVDKQPLKSNPPAATSFMYYTVLETVPEETASDLSPSPRWLSPRVSVDHSVIMDLFENKLGSNLKVRKRSLPTQREGYRWSIGSQVDSETGESIHVSVTSYDDEMALEKEREKEESSVPIPVEDFTHPRRARRKGVYVPPASVLTWLNSQQPISEEEIISPEELPWPFNEQAKLRVSLSEIQLERKESESRENSLLAPNDMYREPSPKLLLAEEPLLKILDSHSRSSSVEPHGRLSVSSIGSIDLERSCSPDDCSRTCETNLVPPSFKRRSRSLSPIVPPREDAIRKATGKVSQDDIQLGTAARGLESHHEYVRVVIHDDKDYKAECQWLSSELNSLKAHANATETTLRAKVDTLYSKFSSSERMLTRQTAVHQELHQELESVKRQLRETKESHEATVVSLRDEARQVHIREQLQFKDDLLKEKALATSNTQDKYTQELNDLTKALQAKTTKLEQMSARLTERTQASSTLAGQLMQARMEGGDREARLRAELEEERDKLIKITELHRLKSVPQMDKEKTSKALALKMKQDLEVSLKRECSQDNEDHPSQQSTPQGADLVATMKKQLKTQQRVKERVQSLYEDKCQEVKTLQGKMKQLAKEHLLLERMLQQDKQTT